MMRSPCASVMVLACFAAVPRQALAQQREPIPLDDVLDMRLIKSATPIAVSPDGRRVAVTVEGGQRQQSFGSRQSLQPDSIRAASVRGSAVYVFDVASGTGDQVSPPGVDAWGGRWSPDGRRLAFYGEAGGGMAVWTWSAESGAGRIASPPLRANSLTQVMWTPDGRGLVVPLEPRGPAGLRRSDPPGAPASSVPGLTVYRAGIPAEAPDSGADSVAHYLYLRATLAVVDVATGRTHLLATDAVHSFAIDPRGQWLAFAAFRTPAKPGGRAYLPDSDVLLVSTVGGGVRVLLRDIPFLPGGLVWSPDGRRLAIRTAGTGREQTVYVATLEASGTLAIVRADTALALGHLPFGIPTGSPVWDAASAGLFITGPHTLYRIDARSGAVTTLMDLSGWTLLRVLASDDGRRVWTSGASTAVTLLATNDSTLESAFLRIDPAHHRVTEHLRAARAYGGGLFEPWWLSVASTGGVVAFIAEGVDEPPDVWVSSGALTSARRVTHLNPPLERYAMGTERIVAWRDGTGQERRGLLLLPPGYRPGQRCPLLVWVYEESLAYAHAFGLIDNPVYNGQLYATRGYALFYPSITWRPRDVMKGLADQVLPGIDRLVALGVADSTRIGLFGNSSGGYDVLALLVQSTRFKAAVESSGWGAADLFSMYATELEGTTGYDWVEKQMGLGAPPWEAPQRYIENSPGYFLNRVTAPLLVMQGGAGDALGVTQSDEVFSGLRRLGKPVEYRLYANEGHGPGGWWSSPSKRDAAQRVIEWFDAYLR